MSSQTYPPLSSEFWDEVERANQAVIAALHADAVQLGSEAPDFTLPNSAGRAISLHTQLLHGPVVLSFHRGGWCPHCRLESRTLNGILPAICELGATVLGVSPEKRPSASTTLFSDSIGFEWLTDASNIVGKSYGLVHPVRQAVYAAAGIDLREYNDDEEWALPVPATYVVAPDRRVAYSFFSADATARADLAEVLRVLRRLSTS